jgi:hypothetical protein
MSAAAPAPTAANIEAILRGRFASKRPASAYFDNAMKNAKYYLSQHARYSLTAEEKAAIDAHDEELWAKFKKASVAFRPVECSKKNPKYAELKAARAAALKERTDFYNLSRSFEKEHRRYLQYYHGAPASKYVNGRRTHYMIYRYYVWELDDDDIYDEDSANTPLGLLNPHAYFAARRAGEANFLDFLDKSQPAPKLPSDTEDWPLKSWALHAFNNKTIEELAKTDPTGDEEWCARCAHCNPAAAASAAAEKIPFSPADSVIVIKSTFRAHSSGSETYGTAVFSSYESASKYIINQFDEGGNALMYWSENDCFEEDDDEEPMEKPTVGWACRRFNPAALKEFISANKYNNKLYGPYSDFCLHCPYELFVELCEVR